MMNGTGASSWRPNRGDAWTLTWSADGFLLSDARGEVRIAPLDAGQITVRRRWWRTEVHFPQLDGSGRGVLRGLSSADGKSLAAAVRATYVEQVVAWYEQVAATIEGAFASVRWITTEQRAALAAARPVVAEPSAITVGLELSDQERRAMALAADGISKWVVESNERIAVSIFERDQNFFDTIETSPLTPEQARAVFTYDNRVHVIAAAGSGKTSVMVGRAAFAVQCGYTSPDRILLLAFNKAAAAELKERIRRRFEAAGISSAGVHATTFHAFGLEVLGHATGAKPSVAPWVADGQDMQMVADIVESLRRSDPGFAIAWDTFRLLYSRLPDDPDTPPEPDSWDQRRGIPGFRTFGGDIVRSHGERILADWLYLHHVPYEYERPYTHPTATKDHRQYHPDFYYPGIDVWHEHWGVDAHGNPPPHWPNYRESMEWKRELHREHGTTLIETTWAGVMDGTDFPRLAFELRSAGVRLSWDPTRVPVNGQALPERDLTRLVRTFMTHVKANSFTQDDIRGRVPTRLRNPHRAGLYLTLYWRIHHEWQARLTAGRYVDFEDMLVQAAEHLEAGVWSSPYDLIMVDEFQDASRARARLTRALLDHPGRHLLAVGDDWQSINRFAGADLGVVTHFHDYFGPGPDIYLSTTFRCHQSIAETASAFIMKNPAQQAKTVRSIDTTPARPSALEGVHLRLVTTTLGTSTTITDILTELQAGVSSGAVPLRNNAMVTVDILGRYRHEQDHMPTRSFRNLRVAFRTVHSAKGLEADYVIVPNLTTGTYGFPSQITDDPILSLAMADPDPYPHAEERRLFYVALTRARRGVILIAPTSTPSPFVVELLREKRVRAASEVDPPIPCPQCRDGVLRPKKGKYGAFWGCNAFPRCRYTQNVAPIL